MDAKNEKNYILGLDLGANSIGWACIEIDGGENPIAILAAGSRIFEAGVEGDLEQGKDESRAVKRREARLQRRQTDRRRRRMDKLCNLLKNANLLPKNDAKTKDKHLYLEALDLELYRRNITKFQALNPNKRVVSHLMPYMFRAIALNTKLEPDELGRAFYHLAQRRGYASNRKGQSENEEERGKVSKGISELEKNIKAAGKRTLGEYFSTIDAEEQRIRERWTSREMYLDEFECIWNAQKDFYPALLTDEFKKKLHKAIFFQRKLKSQKDLVGICDLEKKQLRAPIACFEAQKFRLLQKVNDTRVIYPDGSEEPICDEDTTILARKLNADGDITFNEAKKLLGYKGKVKLNWENGGEKKFLGNRTNARLQEIFGADVWRKFSDAQKEAVLNEWFGVQNDALLFRRAKKLWNLTDEQAGKFMRLSLEEGYSNHSKKALKKLLPLMEKGIPYATAKKQVYPEALKTKIFDKLPMIDDSAVIREIGEIRNPVVHRALTELRKIINALNAKFGKPSLIRIELARDAKKTRKQREQIWKDNRQREKLREAAKEKIATSEVGITQPSRADIEKLLLAEECGWRCPYTGRPIAPGELFGQNAQFDVEHIVPYSRCLDDSFANKTLCFNHENRSVKKNQTPYEAYHGTEKWDEIITRVKGFKSEYAKTKLKKFEMAKIDGIEDFETQKLNDTRYASRLAGHYLALLYGGLNDADGNKRIFTSKGQLTATLRNVWNLNKILGDGGEKYRGDHRHHAIDAIVIALTDSKRVKMLSEAAAAGELNSAKLYARHFDRAKLQEPWQNFYEDVVTTIEGIIVSHRVNKKINGALHQETFYGKPYVEAETGKNVTHVRKPIANLSASELKEIVDPTVKALIHKKLEELGISDPVKAFKEPKNHPVLLSKKDGREIPIHKVRIKKVMSPFSVGKPPHERYVTSDSNHHVEIVETKDKKGNVKWEGFVVSQFDAIQRQKNGEPVVKRDHGEGTKFLFSLGHEDAVLLENEHGEIEIAVVKGFSELVSGQLPITLLRHNDARKSTDLNKIKGGEGYIRRVPNTLKEDKAKKITIGTLGEIRNAND